MANKFLIKSPVISEKAHDIGKMGKYVFLVDKKATKPEIKKALKEIYKVEATDVNISITPGKPRRVKGHEALTSGYKKAYVQLKEGQKLDIMPHVS